MSPCIVTFIAASHASVAERTGTTTVEVDNRGLHPPEPAVRILLALSALATDAEPVTLMDRDSGA